MNNSTYRFTLDLHRHDSQMSIAVFRYDNAVTLNISLTDGGKRYEIEEGSYAIFYGKRADGTPLIHKCELKSNTEIIYNFRNSTTACCGVVTSQLRLYSADKKLITAPKFTIVVESRVVTEDDPELPEVDEDTQSALDEIFLTENERRFAEEARVIAEEDRAAAEAERLSAESIRVSAETLRVSAEDERLAAETSRAEAEAERSVAEAERAEVVGDIDTAIAALLKMQEDMLNGNAELIAKEEVIKAINETLLIANNLDTNDAYKALSAAQGVVLNGMMKNLNDTIPTNYVPNTRTVNGKSLDNDINLLPSDIGATQMESGYYNGTDTNKLELTFSFVPKIVFIVGIILHHRHMNHSFGCITSANVGVNFWRYNQDSTKIFTSSPNVAWNGTTVTITASSIDYDPTAMNIFNTQADKSSATYPNPATEADGYGYWYYAFG